MKLPHIYTIGLTGLLIGFILIFILWLQRSCKEGFQSFTTLNVDYPIREVFIVGDNGVSPVPDYTKGYTYSEADAKCKSYGATMATLPQLQNMFQSLAHWCAGGWVSGDQNNLYYPASGAGIRVQCILQSSHSCGTTPCSSSSTTVCNNIPAGSCIRKMPVQNLKGFALCYGVKPAEGTPAIGGFNPIIYSVVSSGILASVQNDPTDLFPISYTPEQAYYALEKKNFDTVAARKYLRDTYLTINSEIRENSASNAPLIDSITNDNTDPKQLAADPLNGWRDPKQSCAILTKIQNDYYKKYLTDLKAIYEKIQSKTDATYWTKEEIMSLQNEIIGVCANYTAETSPACKSLALIDYTTFYGNSSKILNVLESLNMTLASYQCELQTAFKHLQVISDLFKCSSGSTTAFDTNALGNYKKPDGSYYVCKDEFPKGTDPRFSVDSIGYNSQQSILNAMEGISPLCADPKITGYKDSCQQLLTTLGSILSLPSLNDYSTSEKNFTDIAADIRLLGTGMAKIWNSSSPTV